MKVVLQLISVFLLAAGCVAQGRHVETRGKRPGGMPCWKLMYCRQAFDQAKGDPEKICSAFNSEDCYWYKVYKREGLVCEERSTKALDEIIAKHSEECEKYPYW